MAETSLPEQPIPPVPWRLPGALADMFARQSGHVILWMPVGLGTGVGLYFAATSEPQPWALWALTASALAAWWVIRARVAALGLLAALILLSALGASLASWRAHSVAAPVLTYRYYGPVEGRVIAIDRSASQKPRYTLDRVVLSRMIPARTPHKVRISAHGAQLVPVRPGDTIITTGHLGPPPGPVEPGSFDFQRHVWFKQLGALGYTRVPVLRAQAAEDVRAGPWLWLQGLRYDLSAAIKRGVGGREGPFAAAIITGDRADLDADALATLRQSNLAHLLAISGLHMGLLTGAVFAVVRLLMSLSAPVNLRVNARKVAAVAAFVAAFIYLWISGANIATQRAFIMVSVMLLAICLDRPALSLRAVALAATIVLCLTPEALFSPGFQMSFAATLALVAVFGVVRDHHLLHGWPAPVTWVLTLVLSSAVAGAATAPYAAAHFNQIAQFGLLANLLSVPVMGTIVMPGALLAALGAPLGLEGAGFAIMRAGLAWILGVAEFVSGLEGSTRAVPAPGPWVLPVFTFGGLLLCLWHGAGRLLGVLPVLVALMLWLGVERPALLISESGRLIGVMTPTGRALNKSKGEGFSARVWLENDGDRGDQIAAAGRGLPNANQLDLKLGEHLIRYDASAPERLDLPHLCSADFAIAPRLQERLPSGCPGLIASDFKRDGSMSLAATPQGLRIQTSRAQQGTRLWGIAAQSRKPQ